MPLHVVHFKVTWTKFKRKNQFKIQNHFLFLVKSCYSQFDFGITLVFALLIKFIFRFVKFL